jgi:hypothetical protein
MPRPKALTPDEAKRTLANRFAGTKDRPGLADRLRQLNTRFGLRSKRVFLVWSRFSGEERGEGAERVIARVEILPTPKIADLTAVSLNPFTVGTFPVGSLRISEISATFTADELTGRKVPGQAKRLVEEPVDFFFEVVEDGRGDDPAERQRYRMLGQPDRREGAVSWTVVLERVSEDFDRRGLSRVGVDSDQQ